MNEMNEKKPNTGIFAGIKIGFLCPDCGTPVDTIPNPTMALCPTHNKAYSQVIWTEDSQGKVVVGMEVFSLDQRKAFNAIIESVNRAWAWILNHSHSEPVEETGEVLRDRIGQVEDRLAAVESVLDKDE